MWGCHNYESIGQKESRRDEREREVFYFFIGEKRRQGYNRTQNEGGTGCNGSMCCPGMSST
jgi:hypothetical protein